MELGATSQSSIAILGVGREFSSEHRIRNEILALGQHHSVDGYGDEGVEGLKNFTEVKKPPQFLYRTIKILGILAPSIRVLFEEWWYRNLTLKLKQKGYRFLIPHNIVDGLVSMKSRTQFLFHSHEYLPRQFDGSLLFRLTEMRYRRKALRAIFSQAALIVVEGRKVAEEYSFNFGLPIEKFLIIPSMPSHRETIVSSPSQSSIVRLVHHGTLVPERGIELLLEIVRILGRSYHLTLMGPGPEDYVSVLAEKALKLGNVSIKPPVPYGEIVETLAGNDLGLIIFGSPHYHHKYMTVPNKFWECLQARVPVLVSPDSAMADYINESGCGVLSDEGDLLGYVNAIRNITPEKFCAMKFQCEEKSWQHSRDSWLEDYATRILASFTSSNN